MISLFLSLTLLLAFPIHRNVMVQPEDQRLVVKFLDPGTGVDGKAIQTFKDAIYEAERTLQCEIEFSVKDGSGQGEKTFCFPKSNGACLESFISDQKGKLSGRNDISMREFSSCD